MSNPATTCAQCLRKLFLADDKMANKYSNTIIVLSIIEKEHET